MSNRQAKPRSTPPNAHPVFWPVFRMVLWCLLFCTALAVLATQRIEAQREGAREVTHHRRSNGPRNVPVPRGRSLARAQRLGLGTLDAARELLHSPARPAWVQAARGRVPSDILWPVEEGRFGRGFGYVRQTNPDKRHNGIDIPAPEGSVVRAIADGIVAYSDNGLRGYGNCVMIVHPGGWVTLYAHNSRNTVQPGWRVTRGERIGLIGSTGRSMGPHLHFELHVGGEAVDPMPLMRDHGGIPNWVARAADIQRDARGEPAGGGDPEDSVQDEPGAGDGRLADAADTMRRTGAETIEVGTVRAVRSVLRAVPSDEIMEAQTGRLFRNLLWPVRGGTISDMHYTRQRLEIRVQEGDAVRAAADGLVVFAGDNFPGFGPAVVLLHRNGWVTVYGGVRDIAVSAGDQMLRGQWLGHSRENLQFARFDRGRPTDPREDLVQIPPQS